MARTRKFAGADALLHDLLDRHEEGTAQPVAYPDHDAFTSVTAMDSFTRTIAEAERAGLVSRIVPADKLLDEALSAAEKIASMSRPAAAMAKEAINRAFETPLSEGMSVERNLFHSTFALEDRAEGMAAFIEKRKPVNKNR